MRNKIEMTQNRSRTRPSSTAVLLLALLCYVIHSNKLSLSHAFIQQQQSSSSSSTTRHLLKLHSSKRSKPSSTQQQQRRRRRRQELDSIEQEQKETQEEEEQQRHRYFGTYSARFLESNGLTITTDSGGFTTARPEIVADVELVDEKREEGKEAKKSSNKQQQTRPALQEQPAKPVPITGFNVVLTHCTADFDSLASAVGLAKLWSSDHNDDDDKNHLEYDSSSDFPTFVVLPRGAHPSVTRFLALHKHLFPIRSLKSLPSDLSGLNRLGLVDAQRRDRIGPAEPLLEYANRVTIVDHHLDSDSDISEVSDFILDKVGSVSTLIAERLMEAKLDGGLTEAEATLLALGIHSDTGSLCYDSTTPRDAMALAWVMEQGASQTAIAEHSQQSLSQEQQGVLTQALINANSTVVHGVTVSSVLLQADGFINGLAAVTQDALELSSSDIFLLGIVYEPKAGGSRKKKQPGERITSHLLQDDTKTNGVNNEMQLRRTLKQRPSTLIVIGRVKAGVGMKSVKLGKLLEKWNGGGHAKAASATIRLNDESEAVGILTSIVDEVIETSLAEQQTVGDFMTAPVLSVRPDMSEKQVEDLFVRYDVRALPVVDGNNVIGLVTYKEVSAAKQRMWNKEQKRLRQEAKAAAEGKKRPVLTEEQKRINEERRKKGSAVKAWMLQHIMTVEASRTMAEVETILLENDVGCIPVVKDGTMELVGMVTRTDLLRQHQYYPSLHYHNKGMTNSIAARKPIIALRKKLKKFDLD